jgi:AraC family transcriptional regulator of adaptative response/methylated-DNA-[protein]-cysteine methyltransferase
LTPKDYAVATRASKVRERLASGTSVTEAIYDAGFNSSGRFYEKSTGMLGMTPSQYRAGGANEEIRFAVGETSLGTILVASSKKGVASILLGDDPNQLVHELQDRFPKARLIGADRNYEALVAHVIGFIEAPRIGLDLPLDVRGTAFQRRVWQALQGVPIGQTVSYTEIARRIGSPHAVRAVAGACAANHLAVAIPCHGWCGTTDRSQATRGVSSASRRCLRARRRAAFSSADTVWRVRNLPSAQRNRHLQYENGKPE